MPRNMVKKLGAEFKDKYFKKVAENLKVEAQAAFEDVKKELNKIN